MSKPRCPQCGRPALGRDDGNPAFPFCSARCRTIDLGAWLDESYRVSAVESEPMSEGESEPPAQA